MKYFRIHKFFVICLIFFISATIFAQNFNNDYKEILSVIPESASGFMLFNIEKIKTTGLMEELAKSIGDGYTKKRLSPFPFLGIFSYMSHELGLDMREDIELLFVVSMPWYEIGDYKPYFIIKMKKNCQKGKDTIIEAVNKIKDMQIVDPTKFDWEEAKKMNRKKPRDRFLFFPKDDYIVISYDKMDSITALKTFEGTSPNIVNVFEKNKFNKYINGSSFSFGFVNVDQMMRKKSLPDDEAYWKNISYYSFQFYFENGLSYDELHYLALESSDFTLLKDSFEKLWMELLSSGGEGEVMKDAINISIEKPFIHGKILTSMKRLQYSLYY